MQNNPINCIFMGIIVVFVLAFSLTCLSIFIVLSSTMNELDKSQKKNHDSAV